MPEMIRVSGGQRAVQAAYTAVMERLDVVSPLGPPSVTKSDGLRSSMGLEIETYFVVVFSAHYLAHKAASYDLEEKLIGYLRGFLPGKNLKIENDATDTVSNIKKDPEKDQDVDEA